MKNEHAKLSPATKQYSWLSTQKILAAKAKIGKVCPLGHTVVGYESKKSGIIGAYCFINQASVKKATPDGIVEVERAQIQFTDHSQDPFWVDHACIIRGAGTSPSP